MVEYEYSDLFYDHESVHLIIVDSTAIVTPVSGEAPTIEETELLLTEENIEVEEFNLDESLCSSDNLKFGSCESSCLRFTMYSETAIPSLEDLEIDVYMYFDGDSDTLFKVGRYIVDEDDLAVETDMREITAYDFLYYIYDYDITEWYNDVFEDETTITIKDLRDSLFEWMYDDVIDFDVIQETTTLTNDNYAIEKSIESDVVTFGFFMQGIMEINGVFGHVDREGVFRYISLDLYDDDPVATLDDELLIPPIKYKDWNTWGIGYVAVYDRNNNRLARIGDSAYRHPSVYSVVDSFVFTNNTNQSGWKTNFENAVSNMREAVTHRRYRSCEINCSGNLCLEVGDRIDVTWEVYDDDGEVTGTKTFKTYILERSFSGIQEFDDVYIAKGDKKQPKYKTGKANDNWHVGDNQINTVDGVEGIADTVSSQDFIETIRNIGFRLLDEPEVLEAEYDQTNNQVSLKWEDPDDIDTYEPIPCEWAGTVVVRKENGIPRHIWDGTIITTSTTRDAYKTTALIDSTVDTDKDYYYGIFPYHVYLDDSSHPIKHYRYTKVVKLNTQAPVAYEYGYTGSIQTFTAPKDGIYQIEAWGAQGGNADSARGGYGAYATGEVYLNQGDTLYIVVGGQNGYNGGGSASE